MCSPRRAATVVPAAQLGSRSRRTGAKAPPRRRRYVRPTNCKSKDARHRPSGQLPGTPRAPPRTPTEPARASTVHTAASSSPPLAGSIPISPYAPLGAPRSQAHTYVQRTQSLHTPARAAHPPEASSYAQTQQQLAAAARAAHTSSKPQPPDHLAQASARPLPPHTKSLEGKPTRASPRTRSPRPAQSCVHAWREPRASPAARTLKTWNAQRSAVVGPRRKHVSGPTEPAPERTRLATSPHGP